METKASTAMARQPKPLPVAIETKASTDIHGSQNLRRAARLNPRALLTKLARII
jgi:hypothetical protein